MHVGIYYTPLRLPSGTMQLVWRRNRWQYTYYTVYLYNIFLPACPILGRVLSRLVVVLYYRGGVCDLSLCRRREICKSVSALAPFSFKKKNNIVKNRSRHSGVSTMIKAENVHTCRPERSSAVKRVENSQLHCYARASIIYLCNIFCKQNRSNGYAYLYIIVTYVSIHCIVLNLHDYRNIL